MLDKVRRFIYCGLAIIMLLSGMCMGNTESLFACTLSEAHASYITSCDTVLSESDACTVGMLGNDKQTYAKEVKNRGTNPKREYREFFEILCENTDIKISGKVYTKAEEIPSFALYNETVVLHYIHSSDGEK